jgi:hypothetical protein
MVAVLLGAEALAVSALALDLMSWLPAGLLVSGMFATDQGGPPATETYAKGLALFAVPAGVLSIAGLIRLPADAPPWVRAVSGAAVILAALILALIAYAIWHSTGPAAV